MKPFLPRRAGRAGRVLSVLAALVLAASCADDLTQPAMPGTSPLLATGSGYTATYSIPIPPDSRGFDEFKWIKSSIVVPRDGRYRIRVQGSITVTLHEPYRAACNGGADAPGMIDPELIRTYGPRGVLRFGSTNMQVRVTGNATSPIRSQGGGFSFSEVDPQTMETEVFLQSGTPLYTIIYPIWGSIWCPQEHVQFYNFAGSHTLTITEVVEQPATLVLECNGARGSVSVERGAALSCEARTEPAGGAVTDARWTFQDTGGKGSAITGPAGQNAWGGPMVVGGTVTLAARVNGTDESATASVTVTRRTWRDTLPALRTVYCPAAGVANCPLHNPPVHDKDLGSTALAPGRFTVTGTAVAGGPNTGWHYIPGAQGPIRFNRFATYLNVVLQDPANRLFRGGCSATRVTQWITEHENVHVRKIRRAIDQQRMNPQLEDVVAFSDADFQRALRRANARIVSQLSDIGDGDHSDNDYPSDPCNLSLRPNPGT